MRTLSHIERDGFYLPVVAVLLATGVALRLVNLSAGGLWLDEIWSMHHSASWLSFAEVYSHAARDTHPPLFDLMLHGWLRIFGDSDLAGRSFAVLWSVLGLIATWRYAKLLTGSRLIALAALALTSLHFFHIYYATEVRFYSMMYVLALGALSHGYMVFAKANWKHGLAVVMYLVLLCYTHYYGVLLSVAIGFTAVVLALFRKEYRRGAFRIMLCVCAVAVLFAPWIPVMFSGVLSDIWIEKPVIWLFPEYLYRYSGKNPVEFLFWIAGMAMAFLWGKRFFPLQGWLLGLAVLGFCVPFIASFVLLPLLHERYTVIYLPALILLVAIGWAGVSQAAKTWRLAIWAVWVLSVGVNLIWFNTHFQQPEKEPWKRMAATIAELDPKGEMPVVAELDMYISYYLQKLDRQPAATEADGETAFFVVITPYNTETLPLEWTLVETLDFGNGFRVLRVHSEGSGRTSSVGPSTSSTWQQSWRSK